MGAEALKSPQGVTSAVLWNDRLRQEMERQEIPPFLDELQALVAALREDRPWQHLLTARLRAHPELVLDYLQPGSKRDEVAQSLRRR